jgi:radical SAM superfamily enzyme YgiQ (UPF0313 family)
MLKTQEILVLPRVAKSQASINVTWAYPNSYAVGMAGLGYQLVWWLLDQDCDLNVARAFTDYQDAGWQDCELMGCTLSWELDYANALSLLKMAGVPLLAEQRTNSDPIVFGGGPVLTANPEPFCEFFDVILMGDAEATIPAFLQKWKSIRSVADRKKKLQLLAECDGIYVPSLYAYRIDANTHTLQSVDPVGGCAPTFVKRQVFVAPPDYVAHSLILSSQSSWANMFLVEVVRSCPQECRFCLASYLTRPFRSANVSTLLEKVDLGLRHTRRIGLLGPSVTEHPQFASIAEGLLARGDDVDVSIASIRADSIDPLVLEMLVKLHQRSVTIALESGSERLRAIMKKNLTEDQFDHAMELIAASGLSGVKLYGIAGLPGETDADLSETVRLLTAAKKKYKRLRITFGVSSFVPKAQTPFQRAGRDRESARKIEYLRKHMAKAGIEVRPESHNWSDIQTLLSRGDRRLTPLLLEVADKSTSLGAWKRALRNLPDDCPRSDYFVYRNIPEHETLPWRHLMDDARAAMLEKHNETAQQLSATLQPVAAN